MSPPAWSEAPGGGPACVLCPAVPRGGGCASPALAVPLSCPGIGEPAPAPAPLSSSPGCTAVTSLARRDPVLPSTCRAEGCLHPTPGKLRFPGLSHRGCVQLHHCREKASVTHSASTGTWGILRRLGRGARHHPHPIPRAGWQRAPYPSGHPRQREDVRKSLSKDTERQNPWGVPASARGHRNSNLQTQPGPWDPLCHSPLRDGNLWPGTSSCAGSAP